MFPTLIDRTTDATALKASLDASTNRIRGIADRVARASVNAPAFALPGAEADAPVDAADSTDPVDVEQEMANLADEQLRFEATARLLQKTYAGLRASLRDK